MLGFKTFRCARAMIAGIETMHRIKKGQLQCLDNQASSAAEKFYSLAFQFETASRRCSFSRTPTALAASAGVLPAAGRSHRALGRGD